MESNPVIQINGTWLDARAISSINSAAMEDWERSIYSFLQDWIGPDPVVVQKTSGSTGVPKNIMLLKEHMRNSAHLTIRYFNITQGSVLLLCLPAQYIAGKMMIVRAIESKANLIITKPARNPFTDIVLPIDFVAVTPMQLYASFAEINSHSVKKVLVGGGAVDPCFMDSVHASSASIWHSYAMTETCSHVALKKLNGPGRSDVYTALEGVSFSVDNCSCLQIYAPGLLNVPLQTHDVVELFNEKQFCWVGRSDNIINSGGVKILPEQIEGIIRTIISGDFFISSMPDDVLGQKLVLLLEKEMLTDYEKKQYFIKLRKILPKYHVPKEIIAVRKFVRAQNDKLLRSETMKSLI